MNFKGLIKKGQFQFDKHKGLIFTILSAGFEVAAVIFMAKQAPKAEKVLVPANKKIDKLKEELNNQEAIDNHLIDPAEHKQEIKKIQVDTFKQLSKIYAKPVIFTGLSLTFMGFGYKSMRDKQIGLTAAYVTLENAFKQYRNRVADAVGKNAENDIFRNMKTKTITKCIEDPTTGEMKEIEENIKQAGSGGVWELWFDASSPLWAKNGRINFETLMARQKEANIMLKSQGYLFLYDVIDALDIPKSTISKDLLAASRVIGWIYDPYDETKASWVSFGISDESGHYNEAGEALFNNDEKDIMLSFNCDGNIVSKKKGNSFVDYARY